MKKLINIADLSFSFADHSILEHLNTGFNAGELSVILGRNGSGKSTLFNILSGLESGYKGNVLINDTERKQINPHKDAPVRIGFMPQFHHGTFPFEVFDVLLTGRAAFSRYSASKGDKQIVEKALKSFDLWHLRHKAYTSLSGGERQLILLCRVLLQEPEILLLDEPTNHLDLHYQVAVLEHLKRLVKNGTTVICIMHDPNLALLFGDRFFLMKNKQLTELESLNAAEQVKELENTYNVELEVVPHARGQLVIPKTRSYA